MKGQVAADVARADPRASPRARVERCGVLTFGTRLWNVRFANRGWGKDR